ncbi:MAG: hypothetical protein AAB919_00750 [Patescibacteria group bacterium]
MPRLRNILICAALVAPALAYAQSAPGQDPVQYIVAPETPGPNEPVQITVQGVGTFLGDATITWGVNGKIVKSGTGLSTVSFTTGELGTQTTVRLTISSATQGIITHTFVFTPSVINLLWESDTSVPPLFAGKALYSAGSPLRIIAFPTVIIAGKKVAAESLSYRWSVNDNPVPSASGTGKNILSYTGDQLQDGEQVAVDVYFGSRKVGRGEITIPQSEPQVVLYHKDALRGVVWDRAVPQGIALNGKEITLQAQPYYFSNTSIKNDAVTWEWTLNDEPVTGPSSDKGLLTLRQTGTGTGQATLGVSLQNQDSSQLIQSAKAVLQIVFGQAQSGFASFFGL